MKSIEGHPRLGYRGSVGSRANAFMAKTVAVIAGGVVLASAFVLSLIFFAIAAAVVVVGGGYLWWKTRELRKHMRAQMGESQTRRSHGATFTSNVIEGVVISRDQSSGDNERPR